MADGVRQGRGGVPGRPTTWRERLGALRNLPPFLAMVWGKAKWLKTTTCRDCFITEKRAEEAAAAALSSAAVSHLVLPPLTGTDRQISWASTIRTKQLAALTNSNSDNDCYACLQITDAKWWIDYRDLTDVDLMAVATKASDIRNVTAVTA